MSYLVFILLDNNCKFYSVFTVKQTFVTCTWHFFKQGLGKWNVNKGAVNIKIIFNTWKCTNNNNNIWICILLQTAGLWWQVVEMIMKWLCPVLRSLRMNQYLYKLSENMNQRSYILHKLLVSLLSVQLLFRATVVIKIPLVRVFQSIVAYSMKIQIDILLK